MTDLLRRARALPLLLLLAACAAFQPAAERQPPIVFVHGNGDTAAVWQTTAWRFESNGYDRTLLHAVDFSNPLAPAEDAKPQPLCSTTAEQMAELARKVADVRRLTGRDKLVLISQSRGGNAVRNYLRNGGGAAYVSHAILSGGINHGVSDWEETRGNEFNAKGAFLTQLNAGADEVVAGVRFMTIRSDNNDKYAQPDGRFLGKPGRPTGVGYDGPELKGAENVVIPKIDHRETAFGPLAFGEMYRFITGRAPARVDIAPESEVVLNGKVNGMQGAVQTNLPVAGAKVEIYEVSPATGARVGAAAHAKSTGADGLWGPFRARPSVYYDRCPDTRSRTSTARPFRAPAISCTCGLRAWRRVRRPRAAWSRSTGHAAISATGATLSCSTARCRRGSTRACPAHQAANCCCRLDRCGRCLRASMRKRSPCRTGRRTKITSCSVNSITRLVTSVSSSSMSAKH